jgi:ketosteroid isomerase-like protein
MQENSLSKVGQQFIDALHKLEQGSENDTDAIVALFDKNAKLINSALKLSDNPLQGRADIKTFWQDYRRHFQQAQSEFYRTTLGDRAIGLFWTTKGVRNDGQSINYDGASLLVVNENDRITEFRGYYDTRSLQTSMTANV